MSVEVVDTDVALRVTNAVIKAVNGVMLENKSLGSMEVLVGLHHAGVHIQNYADSMKEGE